MPTKTADDAVSAQAKKQLEIDQKATAKSHEAFAEQTKGKPTPTQEENDLAKMGAHVAEHEPDGSNPDPHGQAPAEGEGGGAQGQSRHGQHHDPADSRKQGGLGLTRQRE
jgi:hypothetical protein